MTEKDYLPQYAAELVSDLKIWTQSTRRAALFSNKRKLAVQAVEQLEGLIDTVKKSIHIVLPVDGLIYRNLYDIPTKEELVSTRAIPAPMVTIEHAISKTYWSEGGPKDAPVALLTFVVDHKQYDAEYQNGKQTPTVTISGSDEQFTQASVINFWKYSSPRLIDSGSSERVSWWIAGDYITLPVPFDVSVDAVDPEKVHTSAAIYNMFDEDRVQVADSERVIASLNNYYGSVNSIIQTCHALRVGATLEERKEKSYTRNRTFEKKGVGGFEYHILRLPHGTVKETLGSRQGDRDGPRYHFRRAHLRNLSSGAQTFVRSCFVGNREKGEVVKNYEMKKETAA